MFSKILYPDIQTVSRTVFLLYPVFLRVYIYSLCIFHLLKQGYRSLTTNSPFQSLSLLIQLPALPSSSPSDHDNPLHPSNMSSPIRLVSAFKKPQSLSLSAVVQKRRHLLAKPRGRPPFNLTLWDSYTSGPCKSHLNCFPVITALTNSRC